jgi:tetratricopeptide (TPR) repeat protein
MNLLRCQSNYKQGFFKKRNLVYNTESPTDKVSTEKDKPDEDEKDLKKNIAKYEKKRTDVLNNLRQLINNPTVDSKTKDRAKKAMTDIGNTIDPNILLSTSPLKESEIKEYLQKIKAILQYGKEITYHIQDVDRKNVGNFNHEKSKNPNLSKDQYLDILATRLNTPEKLWDFLQTFMRFIPDPEGKDYWQTAGETISRIEGDKMIGDCDDVSFLAKEILTRQGKKPFVMYIRSKNIGHATCVWVEKNQFGKFDAFSLCTFGFDKNGNQYGKKTDPKKEKGYDTAKEAINSLMVKFETSGIGLEEGIEYQVTDKIQTLNIPEKGKQQRITIPIEFSTDPEQFQKLQKAEMERDYNTAEKIYLATLAIFPKSKLLRVELAFIYTKQFISKRKADLDNMTPSYLQNNPEIEKIIYKSIAANEALIDKDSKTSEYDYLSQQYKATGQIEKAESILTLGIKAHPDSSILYRRLIHIYAIEKKQMQIENTYNQMLKNCTDISIFDFISTAEDFDLIGNKKKALAIFEMIEKDILGKESNDIKNYFYDAYAARIENPEKKAAILNRKRKDSK